MKNDLYEKCFSKANYLIMQRYPVGNLDILELTELLYKIETEKKEKDNINDEKIDYNDEIIEIEEVGELETIDISVTGDNLFYCNDILTKNSFGLPATVDFMFAIISSEELAALNQLMVKQLKNRFNDLLSNRKFVVGVDRSKMRLYDVEQSAQEDVSYEDRPVMDTGSIGERIDSERKFDKTKFANFR